MTLSELCIRRPVMTTLMTASIIAFGVFGFRLLPVSALPKVDFPTIAVTATLPVSTVHEYGDITIGQTLSQLTGVAQVSIYGAQKFAIRVQADPEAAAARGLSLEDIRAAVARANSSTPVGTLNGPKQDVALQASGQMDKAADYHQIVVAWRNGSPVKLDEVARIYDSVENDKIASWLNDERSIVLGIQKQPDANTVAVVDSLLAKLPALRAQVPPPVDISVLMDRSISIRQAVSDVEETLLIAVALVILVIFLFLRSASATFIPALAVPISLFGTCAAMYALVLKAHDATRKPNVVLRVFEQVFDSWLRAYEWALDWVLAKKAVMLLVTLATLGGTIYLYMIVPKGFFPQEDTGFLIGVTEAATDTSFEAMKVRQQALVDILKS